MTRAVTYRFPSNLLKVGGIELPVNFSCMPLIMRDFFFYTDCIVRENFLISRERKSLRCLQLSLRGGETCHWEVKKGTIATAAAVCLLPYNASSKNGGLLLLPF